MKARNPKPEIKIASDSDFRPCQETSALSVIASEAKQPRGVSTCGLVWVASLSLAMTTSRFIYLLTTPRASFDESRGSREFSPASGMVRWPGLAVYCARLQSPVRAADGRLGFRSEIAELARRAGGGCDRVARLRGARLFRPRWTSRARAAVSSPSAAERRGILGRR